MGISTPASVIDCFAPSLYETWTAIGVDFESETQQFEVALYLSHATYLTSPSSHDGAHSSHRLITQRHQTDVSGVGTTEVSVDPDHCYVIVHRAGSVHRVNDDASCVVDTATGRLAAGSR